MEAILLLLAVLVAAALGIWVMGRIRGAPEPNTMSHQAIAQRIHTEEAWLLKYTELPYASRQSASLRSMYESKTKYIESLRAELQDRQPDRVAQSAESEMTLILQRAAALMHDGKSFDDAKLQALREYAEKSK